MGAADAVALVFDDEAMGIYGNPGRMSPRSGGQVVSSNRLVATYVCLGIRLVFSNTLRGKTS